MVGGYAYTLFTHYDYKGGNKMAQIDINKLKGNNAELAKSNELNGNEQAETGQASAELTDNTSETAEDTSETKVETPHEEESKAGTVVVVIYVGGGIWKDEAGKLWSAKNMTNNILSERQYSKEEYDKREDIKFMVGYGAMKISVVEK